MKSTTERYVKLILRTGLLDSDYVDAYYGPGEWKQETDSESGSVTADILTAEAQALLKALHSEPDGDDPEESAVRKYLTGQISACLFRLRMLRGETFSFDEESLNLYGAVAPKHSADYFEGLLRDLDSALPGSGPVPARLNRFREQYIIPKHLIDKVFQAAIAECKSRSVRYIPLPAGERFQIEYVADKPWSGYNWYKGNFFSLIQINTDLPIYIDRAVDLACHEGYPGHHAYNVLLESEWVKKRGRLEFTVYPLFSPQSLIAEGTANYGIELTFPGEERAAFESNTLFPVCGFSPSDAEAYYHIHELTQKLAYAGNEAARGYLDKTMDRETAVSWLTDYGLFTRERAEQRLRFFDAYRSYVINYNLGLDIVRNFINRKTGADHHTAVRWKIFYDLLTNPVCTSHLTSE